jgi:ankyrin repeat protein
MCCKACISVHAIALIPLVFAALEGDAFAVKCLIEKNKGADISKQQHGSLMDVQLIVAASEGHLMVVRQLLEYGADVNAQDFYGKSALLEAAKYGHLDVVRELVDWGAISAGALWEAMESGNTDVVQALIVDKAKFEQNPFMLALERVHDIMFQVLSIWRAAYISVCNTLGNS